MQAYIKAELQKRCRRQYFFSHGAGDPSRPQPPHYRGFTNTLVRTPLDEFLDITHATYERQGKTSREECKQIEPKPSN